MLIEPASTHAKCHINMQAMCRPNKITVISDPVTTATCNSSLAGSFLLTRIITSLMSSSKHLRPAILDKALKTSNQSDINYRTSSGLCTLSLSLSHNLTDKKRCEGMTRCQYSLDKTWRAHVSYSISYQQLLVSLSILDTILKSGIYWWLRRLCII